MARGRKGKECLTHCELRLSIRSNTRTNLCTSTHLLVHVRRCWRITICIHHCVRTVNAPRAPSTPLYAACSSDRRPWNNDRSEGGSGGWSRSTNSLNDSPTESKWTRRDWRTMSVSPSPPPPIPLDEPMIAAIPREPPLPPPLPELPEASALRRSKAWQKEVTKNRGGGRNEGGEAR
jgi:hypothetical protein